MGRIYTVVLYLIPDLVVYNSPFYFLIVLTTIMVTYYLFKNGLKCIAFEKCTQGEQLFPTQLHGLPSLYFSEFMGHDK